MYGHFPVYEQTDYTVDRQQQLLLPILKQYKVDMYLAGTITRCSTGKWMESITS